MLRPVKLSSHFLRSSECLCVLTLEFKNIGQFPCVVSGCSFVNSLNLFIIRRQVLISTFIVGSDISGHLCYFLSFIYLHIGSSLTQSLSDAFCWVPYMQSIEHHLMEKLSSRLRVNSVYQVNTLPHMWPQTYMARLRIEDIAVSVDSTHDLREARI